VPEESEEAPPKWVAVGNSIKNRRTEHRLTQEALVRRLKTVELSTLKELESHNVVRKRRKGTLEKISAALWPKEETYLDDVLAGRRPEYQAPEPMPKLTINSLRDALERIDERLRNIENRLARPDGFRLPDGTVVTVEVARHGDEPDTPRTP
jgi:transcriptional regulator with XRE-family HTH domain